MATASVVVRAAWRAVCLVMASHAFLPPRLQPSAAATKSLAVRAGPAVPAAAAVSVGVAALETAVVGVVRVSCGGDDGCG